MANIEKRYDNMKKSCDEKDHAFQEVGSKLNTFHENLDGIKNWVQTKMGELHSNELNQMPTDDAANQIAVIAGDKSRKDQEIAELKSLAQELKDDIRTDRASNIDRALKALDSDLAEFEAALREKEAELQHREQQSNEFDNAKTMMLLWLAQMEARVDEFDPVAVEIDLVEKQIAQLQVSTFMV